MAKHIIVNPSRAAFEPLKLVGSPVRQPGSLRTATRNRLDNQLTRAYRQSFGAEQGLRVVVRIATLEMLRDGATRAEIRSALAALVAGHPSAAVTPSARLSGGARADRLAGMILGWCDRAHMRDDDDFSRS